MNFIAPMTSSIWIHEKSCLPLPMFPPKPNLKGKDILLIKPPLRPKTTPRLRIEHDLDEASRICACGCGLNKIGEEVSERLDYVPASVRVLQHEQGL